MKKGICMHCERERKKENLVTLRQFSDKPTLCLKCARIVKKMETGINIEELDRFFKKVSKNSNKKKENDRNESKQI